jgi:hypothetical protein
LFFVFPWFPMCSHYVPFKFPSGCEYVPQVPNVFPNMFSIAPHLYPICFGKCCPPFTYIAGPKERNSILQNRSFSLWGLNKFWLVAKGGGGKKRKLNPHRLMNRSISTKVSQLGKKWVTRFIVDTLSDIKPHGIHATFVWNSLMEI